jgi:predicted  nucleic acid-binding Zn-ribbon protein
MLVWALAAALALSLACKRESKEVTGQMATAQKIAKLEQDIDVKQEKVNQLLRQYVQEGGQDIGTVVGQTLTPEQKVVLEQKLRQEQGIGYRDLINDILAKQKDVEDLKVQVQELEKKLPAAVLVQRGDRHYELAMNYLTKEKGVDAAAAKKLVEQVNLMDELVPGFKVWNFYDNGVYGTFVTQGEASVSPYRVIQRAKQELVSARDTAVSQRDTLAKEKTTLLEQVSDLEKKRDQLNQDVAMLQAEREDLLKKMQDLNDLSEDLRARLNSVFYRIGDRKAMISQGLIQDGVFTRARITNFDETSFPSHLDLRSGDTVKFTAQEAGVPLIKSIKVAPEVSYKPGVDYIAAVLSDGAEGQVKILNASKFRAERTMVIVVN